VIPVDTKEVSTPVAEGTFKDKMIGVFLNVVVTKNIVVIPFNFVVFPFEQVL
jgi:hypothetical protein